MRPGDFARAWKISDDHREGAGQSFVDLPRGLQPVSNGRPRNDMRVLICCYHGLGDTIQFIRYAPFVREIAERVIVCAQPELLPVIRDTCRN